MKKKLILKLIESNDSPKVGNIFRFTEDNQIYMWESWEDIAQSDLATCKILKPIAISDEEIKVGDWCLVKFYTEDKAAVNRSFYWKIVKLVSIEGDNYYFHCTLSDIPNLKANKNDLYVKKIELLPEHFSNDILQLIVEGKLVDGSELNF